ncbi:hypothetical protein C8R46DRAFT_1197397 [Mycena filopes]|nr:hypothetical protein C8R46DRAFT_1197397 [Mycena filopes]
MSGGRRSLHTPLAAVQGSAFHEIVVVPTFVPHLVQPYQIPGTDNTINPVVPNGKPFYDIVSPSHSLPATSAEPNAAGDAAFRTPTPSDDEPENGREFFVHVTLEWTEPRKGVRGSRAPKKLHESKLVSTAVQVTSMSRVEFVPIALGAHDYDDLYVAGVASGPPMRIYWTGSPGGKGGATVVLFDKDWEIIVQKLNNAGKKLDTISVMFDLDTMEGFKQRSKRVHSPDPLFDTELSYGGRVPHIDGATPAQLAMGAAIDQIKAAHACVTHGSRPFIMNLVVNFMILFMMVAVSGLWSRVEPGPGRSNQVQNSGHDLPGFPNTFTSFLKAIVNVPKTIMKFTTYFEPYSRCGARDESFPSPGMGSGCVSKVSGVCVANASPPAELFSAWTGTVGHAAAPVAKARGRTGPFPAYQTPSSSSSTDLLVTTMVPVLAMMAQSMANNGGPSAPPAQRSPARASSPPPAIEEELDVFMGAFRRAKNISNAAIDHATQQLRDARYTPDILSEDSVTVNRLTELTNLAEGEVHQLRRFARQWTSRVEGKRARRGISSF